MSDFTCIKCKQVFTSEKRYVNHLNNTMPCDFKCLNCGKQMSDKRGYYRHKKKCTKSPDKTVNNVNQVNARDDHSNQVNNVNNNNNLVFLAPYGLEHRMMQKDTAYRNELLGGAKEKIVKIVKAQDLLLAYQTLFNHIHGNVDRPEHHNIYMDSRDRDEVCLFTGKQFAFERADRETPALYKFLMLELRWMVGTADIPFNEKDQLLHDIQCHWRLINEKTDEEIRRMLFNNKPVVENTFNNNTVRPNKDMLEDFYNFKRGTLKTFDLDIKLPK